MQGYPTGAVGGMYLLIIMSKGSNRHLTRNILTWQLFRKVCLTQADIVSSIVVTAKQRTYFVCPVSHQCTSCFHMNDVETVSDFGQTELAAEHQPFKQEPKKTVLTATYEMSNDKIFSSTANKSGRPLAACSARDPAQQLYCRVKRVPAAPSTAQTGSVCSFQNLGDS